MQLMGPFCINTLDVRPQNMKKNYLQTTWSAIVFL